MRPYVCGRCGPTEDFYLSGRHRHCRVCRRANAKKNYSTQKARASYERRLVRDPAKLKTSSRDSWLRWFGKNREKSYRKAKEAGFALRLEVIKAYGGSCECCGESNPYFMTVDHVDGGGAKHRREVGISNFYRWLKTNGFPRDGFRLLCANCNLSRGWFGFCPHAAIGELYG